MPEINPESAAPKKRNRYVTGKIHNAAVKVNSKYMTIRLPASLAKYAGVKDKVSYHLTGGVIQIAGEPKSSIPFMTNLEYKKHSN